MVIIIMVRENSRVVRCYIELYLIMFKDMDRKIFERNEFNEIISKRNFRVVGG